jgi:hypothetical protein
VWHGPLEAEFILMQWAGPADTRPRGVEAEGAYEENSRSDVLRLPCPEDAAVALVVACPISGLCATRVDPLVAREE